MSDFYESRIGAVDCGKDGDRPQYEPVYSAIEALFALEANLEPLRSLLVEATPHAWALRLKLPTFMYFELVWQSARLCRSVADEVDWSLRFEGAVRSGAFDDLFCSDQWGEGLRQEMYDLVALGVMPTRCRRHGQRLSKLVKDLGPARGLIRSCVVEPNAPDFGAIFGVVDDGSL